MYLYVLGFLVFEVLAWQKLEARPAKLREGKAHREPRTVVAVYRSNISPRYSRTHSPARPPARTSWSWGGRCCQGGPRWSSRSPPCSHSSRPRTVWKRGGNMRGVGKSYLIAEPKVIVHFDELIGYFSDWYDHQCGCSKHLYFIVKCSTDKEM